MKREDLRWNGWGRKDKTADFHGADDQVWAWVSQVMNRPHLPETPAIPLDTIGLPDMRLTEEDLAALGSIIGAAHVKSDRFERAFHARGQSYLDMLWYRQPVLDVAPDAVVYPQNGEQIVDLLQWAAKEQIAVIPHGGGSSVVGGVSARAGNGQRAVLTLDTSLLDNLLDIDEVSQTATLQAGIYGPQLEAMLQKRGYTLGHYPQSFEFSTLGGWIAARGAGQQSNKYGKAEKWFVSARIATANGLYNTESYPASAAGPRFGDLVTGSEGLFGVIVDATVKVHPVPAVKDYRGWLFKSFTDGIDACRHLVQDGLPMAMVRLSDTDETKFQSQFSKFGRDPSFIETMFKQVISWRGYGETPCLMLTGIEGSAKTCAATKARAQRIIEAHNGIALGQTAGQKWYEGRFDSPYVRDPLMDRGIGVDTFETSTNWANIPNLHKRVTETLRDVMGPDGIIMAHVSHSYHDGASLYFTYVFPQSMEDPIGQWQRIKTAASDCLLAHGGTISHHHGVGEDHKAWFDREKGALAKAALLGVKAATDPDGILNPGKML